MPEVRVKAGVIATIAVMLIVASYLVYKSSEDLTANRLGGNDDGGVSQAPGYQGQSVHDRPARSSHPAQTNRVHSAKEGAGHHVPDYGAVLSRGGAQAFFQLLDAKGQSLSSNSPLEVRVFRASGERWLELHGSWHFADGGSTLVVDGRAGAGLEPGVYEIEIEGSPYGAKRHRFALVRNQLLRDIIDFEHWRKILTLVFVDQSDVPLSRLGFRPQVSSSSLPLDPKDRKFRAQQVLANGQTLLRPKNVTRPQRNGSKEPKNHAYLLDQGKWHLPIYVGATNKIDLDFDPESYGRNSLQMVSDFTEGISLDSKFVVTLSAERRRALESMPAANPDDFGNGRMISTPPALQTNKAKKRTHPAFLDIELIGLTPTLAAYTLATRVEWNYRNQVRSHRTVEAMTNEIGSPARVLKDVAPLVVAQCASVAMTLGGAGAQYGHGFHFDHKISDADRDDLASGKLIVRPPSRGIVMRVVDSSGKPLPWAEASLVSLEDDRHAQDLRSQLAKRDLVVDIGSKHEGESHDDYLNRRIREDLPFVTGESARRHLRRYGTWYDPDKSRVADVDGFLFFEYARLKPQASYVLYVWGVSRDANAPDLRVLFRAQSGLTDLGAITIPPAK